MSAIEETIEGTLDSNGQLRLSHQPRLPPGPVRVTIRVAAAVGPRRGLADVIREIAADQRSRGFPGRSAADLRGGLSLGGDRTWPRPRTSPDGRKPWSVRTREATHRAGLDGPWVRAVLRLAGRTDHHAHALTARASVGVHQRVPPRSPWGRKTMRRIMIRQLTDLPDAELAVLQTLWERGPCTIRQLADTLYPSGTDTHYATVQKLLERLEANLFRGASCDIGTPQVFGGQVLGQALAAAYSTVGRRDVHSLHAYFLRPGDVSVPKYAKPAAGSITEDLR